MCSLTDLQVCFLCDLNRMNRAYKTEIEYEKLVANHSVNKASKYAETSTYRYVFP